MNITRIREYVNNRQIEFNGFLTVQDQKYFLYDVFKYCHFQNILFICLKMNGSNQIILYYEDKEIYNSDKAVFTVKEYSDFMIKHLSIYLKDVN